MIKEKTLNNTSVSDAREKISDIEIYGHPDTWVLLSKASSESEGWMKSTKAMQVYTVDHLYPSGSYVKGVLVQTTTQQKNLNGSYSISDTTEYIPGVQICYDKNNNPFLGDPLDNENKTQYLVEDIK